MANLTIAEISKPTQLDGTGGHGICGALDNYSLDFAMFQPWESSSEVSRHALKWHCDFKRDIFCFVRVSCNLTRYLIRWFAGGADHRSVETPEAERSFLSKIYTHIHTYIHTHLLRNILSNYWCGMHHTCKNTWFKSDRRDLDDPTWKPLRSKLSTSLHEGSESSDAALSDCENRTGTKNWKHGTWQLVQQFKLSFAGTSGWSDHSSTEMP